MPKQTLEESDTEMRGAPKINFFSDGNFPRADLLNYCRGKGRSRA